MASWKQKLDSGLVIPACPLALNKDGSWSETHQAALARYYVAAGAGGLAVGVHSTQFEIRDAKHQLYKPLLKFVSDILDESVDSSEDRQSFVRIAGVCGKTRQALNEAEYAVNCGYQAALLSLTAMNCHDVTSILEHCRQVSLTIPIVGFYLQPAVGGRILNYSFWRASKPLASPEAARPVAALPRRNPRRVVSPNPDSVSVRCFVICVSLN